MSWRSRTIALCLVTFIAAAANADSTNDETTKRQAKLRYEAGQKYFRLGDFKQSVAEFRAAYEIYPTALLLFNIAQAYRQLEDYRQALFFYKQYLATGEGA